MTEIWNLSTLCRCCHSDGCFRSLNMVYQGEKGVEVYERMLLETLAITISQPPLPVEASYTICDECIIKLRDASQFKQQVLACEHKFQIYCNNEQFLDSSMENLKSEIESVSSVNDDQHIDCDDHSDNEDGYVKTEITIKEEIPIEIEISSPIRHEESHEEFKEVPITGSSNTNVTDEKLVTKTKVTTAKKTVRKNKLVDGAKKRVRRNKNKETRQDIYNTYISREQHNKIVTYTCKKCGGCFNTKKEIFKHISVQHQRLLTCVDCGAHFLYYKNLMAHKKTHLIIYNCNHCDKKFSSKPSLRAHEHTHTQNTIYKCDICQKELKYKNTLKKHIIQMHSDAKVLLCDICGRSFKQKSNLEAHIRAVHMKLRPYACPICGKTYTAKKHVLGHMKTAHSSNPKPHACDICPKEFACPKSLKIHKLGHDNQYPCRYCSLIFDDKSARDIHVQSHSTQSLLTCKFSCPYCGKMLQTKYSLERHIETHNGIKRFACHICGVKFTQKGAVRRHCKKKHDPNINYVKSKCVFCKKSFRNIDKHMEIHNDNAKKYCCDICGKSYSENNALTRHKSQKHYGMSHDCEFCGKKYMNKRSLVSHKIKVHKVKKEINESDAINEEVNELNETFSV